MEDIFESVRIGAMNHCNGCQSLVTIASMVWMNKVKRATTVELEYISSRNIIYASLSEPLPRLDHTSRVGQRLVYLRIA